MAMDEETLGIYLEEGYELLEKMGAGLEILSHNSSDQEAIKSVFMVLHTLKGNTGFAGLDTVFDLFSAFTEFMRPVYNKTETLLAEDIEKLGSFKEIIEKTLAKVKVGESWDANEVNDMLSSLNLKVP